MNAQKPMFTNEFFKGNRKRLLELLPDANALVVITANGLQQRSADTTYPFTQDKNFWYLTGVDEPNVLLVMSKDSEYLIAPRSNAVRDTFDGALDHGALRENSGISDIMDFESGRTRLRAELIARRTVHTCAPFAGYDDRSGMYTQQSRSRLVSWARRAVSGIVVMDVRKELAQLRMVKQGVEIAAIEHAVRITTQTLAEVRTTEQLGSYAHEYELEAALTQGFRQRGAAGHAYEPIVASGSHATTLHYTANSGTLLHDSLTVVDVGAEFAHYAADITRTVLPGKPSERQVAVHAAVQAVQRYALSQIKPGMQFDAYERAVVLEMGLQLQQLGLIDDPKDAHSIRRYYPHATSHFLGLDVHDVGDYHAPLTPGVVLTCEPGIYIPEEGIGVRLEDDVVVTDEGCRNLSAHCSYDLHTV